MTTLAFILFIAHSKADTPARNDGKSLFRDQVRALLTTKCIACHDADKKRGGLDLTRRTRALTGGDTGAAIKPDHARDSLLYQRVQAREMPPKNPLSAEQIELLKKWIDLGAPYEDEPLVLKRAGADWWSLQPVRVRAIPQVNQHKTAVRTPIDSFIVSRLEQEGLAPSPEADRRTLVRRLTYDLTGLPPTPEEVERARNDQQDDWYERLVDRLLASPAYGERWGRHWLDVTRFAESHGYEMNNLRPNAWPYRDYVIRSFNEDTPYPRRILEQLAGDTLADGDTLVQSATGFIVGGASDRVFNGVPDILRQQRMDDLDDMVSATGATFLGLTLNCCRCHDHKFDPLTQKDYYALQAVFTGVQHADRNVRSVKKSKSSEEIARLKQEMARIERSLDSYEPLANPEATDARRPSVNPRRNVERFRPVEAKVVRMTILATHDQSQPCIDEIEIYTGEENPVNVALASAGAKVKVSSTLPGFPIHKTEHLIDGRHGNSASWIANEAGRGSFEIEFPKPTLIERIVWGRDREGQYRDRLAIDYKIEAADDHGKWSVLATAQDRKHHDPRDNASESKMLAGLTVSQQERYRGLRQQQALLTQQLPDQSPVMPVYAGRFDPPPPTHVLLRGDASKRGEAVAPGVPAAVRPALSLTMTAPESERRLALARWLGNSENPLTARVMVNRVWHYHFGQGLVSTPSDFGYNGDPPSHPDLLDWLASEFIRNDWQLKPLHRLIVTSATYRQSGQADEKALKVDRGNRLLWRMTPRRLEAEAIRDSILSAAGRLDRRMGGPGYYPWVKNSNYVTQYKPKAQLDPDDFRRMVYQWKVRSQHDDTFGLFDCPDAATARPRRTTSTTVLQALNLLNGPFVLELSESFAERLRREAGDDLVKQVDLAFLFTVSRSPSPKEAEASLALVRSHGLPMLCRALYNANEFLYID